MFWDKSYTPSQNIEALLEKENATVEEFLDDEDILQECKSLKKGIINYFTRPDIIKRLIEFIITEPSEDLPMVQRFRYANMACEILTLGIPSLDEKLLSDTETLKSLYSYLENEPPLNPLLSSFFSKTFSMLFTKKPEQDWFLYQQMCLQLLEYIKTQNNFLDLICKHFSTPVIPDLVMQMMRDVEGGQLKRNLYEWLTKDKLVERLIAILGNPQETDKHANVAEFICDLIQQGRLMRQTEQENDSFEPAFDGSNPILKNIESESTIEALLNVILEPNAQESAIVSGISVVLTLIKPIVFLDEPTSDRMKFIHNREKDIHEQILATVISVIAPRLKDFNELLRNPPNKPEVVTTAAKLSPPFGQTRLQICRLFTVLLQTRNEKVSNAICETDFFETLLALFKQYCWNNFLHSEVEKCLQLIFYTQLSNNNNSSTHGSTVVEAEVPLCVAEGNRELSQMLNELGDFNIFDLILKVGRGDGDGDGESSNIDTTTTTCEKAADSDETPAAKDESNSNTQEKSYMENSEENSDDKSEVTLNEIQNCKLAEDKPKSEDDGEISENDTTKIPTDTGPSAIQSHVITNCKLISKLIDCWQHNTNMESAENGRRLGYMGHLIKIFKHITSCISESEHIGALIESNLNDASELELWQSIINPNDGDFTKALATQSKMLANCNAHEAGDYSQHLAKDFLPDNSTWDYIMTSNLLNNLGAFDDTSANDIVFALEHEMFGHDLLDNDDNADNDLNLFQFGRNIDDDDDDDDEENPAAGDGHSLFGQISSTSTSALQSFGVTSNPWDNMDPFRDVNTAKSGIAALPNSNATPWAGGDFGADNFADFDSHFSSFTNDLGESLTAATKGNSSISSSGGEKAYSDFQGDIIKTTEEYDNNANVEKSQSDEFVKFETDDNALNEKVASSLVRTLHSVMQDSEDDYEDDEGMWTKPLGGAATEAAASAEQNDEDKTESETSAHNAQTTTIPNGPSKQTPTLHELENNEELNRSIDQVITSANITTSNFSGKLDMKSVSSNELVDNEDATKKHTSSTTNAITENEIAPTSPTTTT